MTTSFDLIEIFSTSPQSKDFPRESYVQNIINVAQWSEEAGCTAILVYTDNSLVDAWLVAQIILQNTQKLCPLVAIQPIWSSVWTTRLPKHGRGGIQKRPPCPE